MKPFNLEEAKAGMPVRTTDGCKVRIVCFDQKGTDHPIIALIDHCGVEIPYSYNEKGEQQRFGLISFPGMKTSSLMMDDGKTRFVARFYKEGKGIIEAPEICNTRPEAEMKYKSLPFFVDIIEVDR